MLIISPQAMLFLNRSYSLYTKLTIFKYWKKDQYLIILHEIDFLNFILIQLQRFLYSKFYVYVITENCIF